MPTSTDARLPVTALPQAYRLTLSPDLTWFTFTGTVEIDVEIPEPTDTLICNAIDLEINNAQIRVADTTHRVQTSLDPDQQRLTLRTNAALSAGPATVTIDFAGTLNDQLHGFYRSTYTDRDGTEQVIATTQFQSTDARRCFPCWDEPAYKATFTTSLVVDADHLAISNTKPHNEYLLDDGRRRIDFAPTMPMSTYLVAFVVGPLEATEPIDVDGVPLRIVHRPGQGHLTEFACDVAAHALRWFSNYYGIPYPSDKVDLVAIPDFAFGAMENLGCVTFREVLLLIDPEEASQPECQRAADVINHELAHMWFGDLVTMAWWEGIWLNEAFATFMEVSCTNAYRPDWKVWESFARARSAAFDVDALHHTRPIEYPVITPADAEGMFDLLTYEKGAAVVRMLEQFLGEDVFRDGVRSYLNRHAYANTKTSDLWDALEEVSNQPVRALMHDWIYQGGHPIVAASLTPDGLRIEQRHFTLDPEAADGRYWSVPIRFTRDDVAQTFLLTEKSAVLPEVATLPRSLNVGGTGFFRSAIDGRTFPANASQILAQSSPTERHSIVDDLWALTVAGEVTAVDCLLSLETFRGDDDLNVWQALSTALHGLDRVTPADAHPAFAGRTVALARPSLQAIGNEPTATDDDRTRELRATLVRLLGTIGSDPDMIEQCRGHLDHPDPSLAAAALAVVAHHGGTAEFATVWDRWREATDPQSEQRHLRSLADFRYREAADQLTAAILGGTIRSQDGPYVLARALTNRSTGAHIWDFIETNWTELTQRFPSNSIARMLSGITALDTEPLLERVGTFLDANSVPQAGKQVLQHRERHVINTRFRTNAGPMLSDHLRSAEHSA